MTGDKRAVRGPVVEGGCQAEQCESKSWACILAAEKIESSNFGLRAVRNCIRDQKGVLGGGGTKAIFPSFQEPLPHLVITRYTISALRLRSGPFFHYSFV